MQITYRDALIIGVFQLIAAIFPGTSRSGATIIGGLLIGLSRVTAAEFTFYLAIPVMFGASLLKLIKFGLAFTGTELAILIVGMVVAFIVSVLVIIGGFILMLCTDSCFSKGLTQQEVDKLKILIVMMAFNTAIAFPISVFSSIITAVSYTHLTLPTNSRV